MASVVPVVPVASIEMEVGSVRIRGLKKTKGDIVAEQIKNLFAVRKFDDLIQGVMEAKENLRQLDIFKSIDVTLDTSGSSGGKAMRSKEEKVDVIFRVQEKGQFHVELGMETGTQAGGAHGSVMLRNVFGRAEKLQMKSGTTYPHWGYSVQLEFIKPYYKDLSKMFKLSLGNIDNKVPTSGYQEFITGSSAEVSFPSWLGHHSLSLNCQCRNINGFSPQVPMSVREEAGYSLKSSIKHTFNWDNRDDILYPKNGCRVKVINEVAGLGGDVHFSKLEIQSEILKEIFKDCVVSLSLWGGCLDPFSPSHINDRFLLGGPTSLRGFGLWGAGPHDLGFSLGGEAFWASGLHVYTPVPYVRHGIFSIMRLHGFITAGNIIKKYTFSPSTLKSLASDVRVSCGVGLTFRLSIAQIELNYAIPLRAHSNDRLSPGLQLGIGIDIL